MSYIDLLLKRNRSRLTSLCLWHNHVSNHSKVDGYLVSFISQFNIHCQVIDNTLCIFTVNFNLYRKQIQVTLCLYSEDIRKYTLPILMFKSMKNLPRQFFEYHQCFHWSTFPDLVFPTLAEMHCRTSLQSIPNHCSHHMHRAEGQLFQPLFLASCTLHGLSPGSLQSYRIQLLYAVELRIEHETRLTILAHTMNHMSCLNVKAVFPSMQDRKCITSLSLKPDIISVLLTGIWDSSRPLSMTVVSIPGTVFELKKISHSTLSRFRSSSRLHMRDRANSGHTLV